MVGLDEPVRINRRRRLAIAATYIASLLGLAFIGAPLGHDEAQYALGGALLLGRDVTTMPLYRPIGMKLVAAPGVLAGGSDLAFRVIAIACTLALLSAASVYARRAYDARVAGWATVIVATSFAVVRRATELLPDALAGACALAFAMVLIGGLRATERRWALIWLGPLAVAAFYLRYGSIAVLGAMTASAAIVWPRRVVANAGPLVVAGVVVVVGAIPHVIASVDALGSASGILRLSSLAAGRDYLGEGLVFYATAWLLWLGPAAAACVVFGLVAAVRRRDDMAKFAGLASVLTIVALGLDAHGEARFVLVPEVLLVVSGVHAILAMSRPRPRIARVIVAACMAGSLTASAIAIVQARRTFEVTVRAGAEVRRAAAGAPCVVFAAPFTQLEWYSGCAGALQPDPLTPAVLDDRATFLVWFDEGRRQPVGLLDNLLARRRGVRAELVARVVSDGLWGNGTVYRLHVDP